MRRCIAGPESPERSRGLPIDGPIRACYAIAVVQTPDRKPATGNTSGTGTALRCFARRSLTLIFALSAYVSRRVSGPWVAWCARGDRHALAVRVIAHRGASAYAPENSLEAFRRAVEQGAREIELDVQLSCDDELIVFHDPALAPKTNAAGCVRDHAVADLRQLEIGTWFDATDPARGELFEGTRLATLGEVFEAFADGLHYHVEIKSEEASLPERILAAVHLFDLGEHATLTSFCTAALLRVRELDPGIPICQLVRNPKRLREEAMDRTLLQDLRSATLLRREIERAAANGFDQVALPANCLSRRTVRFAKKRGIGIRAWRIPSEIDLDRVIVSGAEGVTVNWPDRAIAHLAARAGA